MGELTTRGKKSPSKDRNRFIGWGLELVQTIFPILLITYLLLILLETIFEGSVSFYINLNHLLIIVIIVGVTAVLTAPSKVESAKGEHLTAKSIFIIICAGIGGAAIMWYKTQEIGWLSYVLSVVGGGLIVLLSMLIWRGDEEAEQKYDERTAETELKTKKEAAQAVKERAKREIKEAIKRIIKETKEAKARAIREAKQAGHRAIGKLKRLWRGPQEKLKREMRDKIASVAELSYLQLAVIFLILVLLSELNIFSLNINYQLFACVLPLLAIPVLLRFKPSEGKRLPAVSFILLAAFLFTFCIRLLPSTQSSIPLGYDPGFYKYTMELYASALPQIPEAGLAAWVKQMYPQGLFVLSDAMHVVAGTNTMQHINYLFPFLGALLVFPLFVVTRSLFGQRVGVVAAILYAISYTQYTTFAMLYFKNVLGLMFVLLAIYALEKKKYGLMALMFAALGIFHRPEFLLFALILIPYFILHRRREIILAVLVTAVLIAPFWLARWEVNWGVLSGTIEAAVTNIQTGEGLGGGTFFGFDTYTTVSLAYLPFSLMGAIYLAIKRNWNSILFYFVISSIIVVCQLFFFKRFIIPLDIAVVILAAVGIDYTLLHRREVWRVVGVAAVVFLLVATALPTMTMANNVRPLISEEQLETVEWIRENAEDDAYVLATSNDAPWVLGWSGRRVIAPGLFEWNVHSKEEWFSFFGTKDPEAAKEFLDVYDAPVYIYYSKNWGNYLGLEKFQGDYFRKVYDNGAVVYKYSGGG